MSFVKHNKTNITQDLKQKLENQSGSGGSRPTPDHRFLNYYDLGDGESMKIVLIPTREGEYIKEFSKHGAYSQEVSTFPCRYMNQGQSCPICLEGYKLFQNDERDAEGRPISDHLRRKKYVLAQCVVIDSPIEVQDHGEDTIVHLIWLPIAVLDKMKESIDEGIISDDVQDHVLVLKKRVGSNGRATYTHSYFRESKFEPDETLTEAIENGFVEPFDLNNLQTPDGDPYIPGDVSEEEAKEWFDQAVAKLRGENTSSSSAPSTQKEEASNGNANVKNETNEPSPEPSRSEGNDESSSGNNLRDKLKSRMNRSS